MPQAQHTISYRCGHQQQVTLTGSEASQERQVQREQERLCSDCYRTYLREHPESPESQAHEAQRRERIERIYPAGTDQREARITHAIRCAQLCEEMGLLPEVFKADRHFGQDEESIRAAIAAKAGRDKRRAGFRALESRYGRESARRIVARHAERR